PFALPPWNAKPLDLPGDLRGLRIAWCPSPTGGPVDPNVAPAAEKAVRTLGARCVEVEQLDPQLSPPVEALRGAFGAALAKECRELFPALRDQLSPTFAELVSEALTVTLDEYVAAQVARSAFIEQIARLFERYDVLATPTTAIPAFPTEHSWGPDHVCGQAIDPRLGWCFTWPFNLTAQPAISLPCGRSGDGLPYGLQLVGRRQADELLLRVAAALEETMPWPQGTERIETVHAEPLCV
ncbi:MAG TPA: amidase family protein, partial [Gemmataceae bacterium]|nr:amidase family protein [Gemmataceae bacterium]